MINFLFTNGYLDKQVRHVYTASEDDDFKYCKTALSKLLSFINVIFFVSLLLESLLTMYLNSHLFTELHLDGIFKYGDDNTLPTEVRGLLAWKSEMCFI